MNNITLLLGENMILMHFFDSKYIDIMMIIFINKKNTLQIMTKNKEQSPNLIMLVESYKTYLAYN